MRREYLVFGTVLFTLAVAGCGRYTRPQVTEYCRAHPDRCQEYCEDHPGACTPYLGGQSGSATGGSVGTGGVVGTGGAVGTGGSTEVPDAAPVTPDAQPACFYNLTEDGSGCISNCYQTQRPTGLADKALIRTEQGPGLYMVLNASRAIVPITVQVAMQWLQNDCENPVVPSSGICQTVTQIAAADATDYYHFTVFSGVHVPPRMGSSVLTYNGNKYVSAGLRVGINKTGLRQLQPATLETLIFPDAAAVQQPIPAEEFTAQFGVVEPVTSTADYNRYNVCFRNDDVVLESSFLFAPPPPPPPPL